MLLPFSEVKGTQVDLYNETWWLSENFDTNFVDYNERTNSYTDSEIN